MSIISSYLERILKQKESPIWSGYVNMLKLLKSIFSPKHWVLEFLQNAEDAKASKISIRLEQDSLYILNNGEVFQNEDFYSICNVNSGKSPDKGAWGYLGIGFKSIFQITNEIHIHSGDFHFMFNKKEWNDHNLPWEILPVEINPITLPENYTTGFYIPLQDTEAQKVLEEIKNFLTSNSFSKEVIVFLKNIKYIEVYTPQMSFTIRKEQEDHQEIAFREKEIIVVKKEPLPEQGEDEKSNYLVFRKIVEVPSDIKEDETTIRVRRSNVHNRAIGIVFELDKEKNIQSLIGKLAGVYSFLPVEGEQTGLPFGIFGDFIPHPGRDIINYVAKWNYWLTNEITELFKTVVKTVLLDNPRWKFFPAQLINLLNNFSPASFGGPSRDFWEERIREPIRDFLKSEALYPDKKGIPRKLNELVRVDEGIINILEDKISGLLEKKIVHPIIEDKLGLELVGIYYLIQEELLEHLKSQPEKLASCYNLIDTISDYYIKGREGRDGDKHLKYISFVLADDGELYPPYQVTVIKIEKDVLPKILVPFIPEGGKLLHPKIAEDEGAVRQLERCGINTINGDDILRRCRKLIENITEWSMCPKEWKIPDTLIEATLSLIISEGYTGLELSRLVAQDGSLQPPEKIFFIDAPSKWTPFWKPHFFSNLQPVHEKYFMQENLKEEVTEYIKKLGVIDKIEDSQIIQQIIQQVKNITCREKCPESWEYHDTLIEVTLFLIAHGKTLEISQFVAQDGTFHAPQNLFVPGAPLDWAPLWKEHLFPGFKPIHEKYLEQREILEKVREYFNLRHLHGFERTEDKSLVETVAYEITERKLRDGGHQIGRVSNRDELGYDLECQGHCKKVFEVKGMGEPCDVKLEKSEYQLAKEKGEDYILICVYNLPNKPKNVGYKEISNPAEICEPIEEAKVPKNEWWKRQG